jgi:U3 small nucleolar RNA-associated protein 12
MAGEKIAEALELGMSDLELMSEWESAKATQPNIAPPPRNPLFIALGGVSAEQHVLNVLQKIQAAALRDALLVLPFVMVPSLFTFLNIFAMRSMNIPLTCRVLFFMLKTHHRQIVASKTMKPMLQGIKGNLRASLKRQKDEIGFNLAALRIITAKVTQKEVKDYVDEDTWDNEGAKNGRKRGFVQIA